MKRLALLLLAIGAAACQNGSGSGEPVATVTITPDPAGVGVNDTVRLTAVAKNANNQPLDTRINWQSLNTSIATVTSQGVVRGVAPGTTQIQATAGGRTAAVNLTVASGVTRIFNVNAFQTCANAVNKTARRVASSNRVEIYEDITNPPGGPTEAQYQQVANTVENLVYDVNVANFGAPTDIDSNGRIIVLYSRAVNELTPANAGYIVGGFMYARDLFPKTQQDDLGACAGSNVAEMFYMLSADPAGAVNNNARSVDYVLSTTVGIVAHEFQHVINSGRRLRIVGTADWEETLWLGEGLSHIAEELTFYNASGRAPRQNLSFAQIFTAGPTLDAFAAYGVANIDRFDSYLDDVRNTGPYQDVDLLEMRGAIWGLLRYMADRRGGNDAQLWFSLVNSTPRGLPNLQAAIGADPMIWTRDFAIANYTDDAVAAMSPLYTHPSWNYRSIMTHPRYGGYGLEVIPLTPGNTSSVNVRAGSAAYFRFGVEAGGTGDVRVAAGGTTVANACTPLSLGPGEVFHGTPANASAVCLPGGVAGAEYLLVTFYGARDADNESANSNSSVSVVGTGIRAPIAPPSPSPDLSGAGVRPMPRRMGDGGFEGRLRARERAELRALTPRTGNQPPVLADPAAAGTHISVVRIR